MSLVTPVTFVTRVTRESSLVVAWVTKLQRYKGLQHCMSCLGLDRNRLEEALARTTNALLAARTPDGHWVGELSSSALSTATAVVALAIVERERAAELATRNSELGPLIARGLAWLAKNANADGGWGDTNQSLSNLSTTALCWAAFGG